MDNGDKVTYTMEDDSNTGRVLKGTDALGNTTHYTYTSSVEDKTIADPLGNTTTLLHDLAGRITQATDPLG